MRRPALLLAVLLAAIDIAGLAPSVHVHDAGELTAAAWTLGIGHPPGAPLYMLLQKGFMLLVPLGHIAWRANLFSAFCAVGAFLLFEMLAFALTKREWRSAFSALAFALSCTFRSQAVMAEVYALQAALLAGFLLALVRGAEAGRPARLPALLWGLLLACHMGLALVTPLVWLVLVRPAGKGWSAWWRAALPIGLWMAGPLLLYLYLPLRSLADPAVDWGDPETLRNFWWHFTNRQVRGRMLSLPPDAYLRRAAEYGMILVKNLHLLLPFAALGAWRGRKEHRRLLLVLGAVWAMDAAFVVLMDTAPLGSEAYAIPSALVGSVMAVLGLGALRRSGWAAVPAAAAAVSAALCFSVNDLGRNFLVRDTAEALLQQAPRGAVLFTQEDNTTNPLAYLVEVEGARRDLELYDRQGHYFRPLYREPLFLVPPGELPKYRKMAEAPVVRAALREGRAVVYSSPFLDYRPEGWALVPSGQAARATLGEARQNPAESGPVPRIAGVRRLDWMSRQMVAEAGIRSAHAEWLNGDGERARAALDTVAPLADIPEQHLRIAQLRLHLQDPQRAAGEARRALAEAPALAPAWSVLGYALMKQGKTEEAERALRRALELDPSLPQPHAALGTLAAQRGDYAAAAAAFARSLELDPGRPEVEGMMRKAGVCAAVQAAPVESVSIPDLRRLLIDAAACGFPECVREWLGSDAGLAGDRRELAEAYLRAAAAVRSPGGNKAR